MGDAITKTAPSALQMTGIRIGSMDDVWRLADALSTAQGFIPSAYLGKPGAIAAAILTGAELGIGPMEAIRSIHVVEGKPGLASEAMLARAIRAGVRHEWLSNGDDGDTASIKLTRPGFAPYTQKWSLAHAKAAGLAGKGNWSKYTPAMLRARCVSAALRAYCPDVLGACVYGVEELEEMEPPAAGSTGSAEVRDLGAALHEVDEADASTPDPFVRAADALTKCKTDGDLRTWVKAFSRDIESAPDDSRRRGLWADMKQKARGVMPAVTVATITAWFAEERAARAPKPDAVDGVTEDGEVTPAARAMAELQSVETPEAAHAWLADNRDYLANIGTGSSEERIVWAAVRARVGEEMALELEGSIS